MTILPISVVIPTLNRRERLNRTLRSLLDQNVTPAEIIIVDASPEIFCASALNDHPKSPLTQLHIHPATVKGAAAQRNQAIGYVTQDYVLFADDDVDLEPGCLERLWTSMMTNDDIGATGVVMTNQSYHPPGHLFRRLLTIFGCPARKSLAGQFCGPALNFLPEKSDESTTVEWLNLCLTLIRRRALPTPALLPFFEGYSLLEDAALTYHISKAWKLTIAPQARAFHDMKPADYKSHVLARTEMEIVNRWFVMSRVLSRNSLVWNFRFIAYQFFTLLLSLRSAQGWQRVLPSLAGMLKGFGRIIFQRHKWHGYPSPTPL